MTSRLSILVPLAVSLAGCQAQPAADVGPVEGAWRLTALVNIAADGARTEVTPQESLIFFGRDYYSMAYAFGDQRSPYYAERFNPTDEESLARMNSMTVNTGTYEVDGSQLILRPLVARVPEFVNGLAEHEYELSGDTLTLTWGRTVSEDGIEAPGVQTVLTLIRIR